jgi:hypothetical protein
VALLCCAAAAAETSLKDLQERLDAAKRAQQAVRKPGQATLIARTDSACSLSVGGRAVAELDAGPERTLTISPGPALVDCRSREESRVRYSVVHTFIADGKLVVQLELRDKVLAARRERESGVPQSAPNQRPASRIAAASQPHTPAASDATVSAPVAGAPAPRSPDSAAFELAFWDSIKSSTHKSDFEEYLAQYPDGRFAGLARNRVAMLAAEPQPAMKTAPNTAAALPAIEPSKAAASSSIRLIYRLFDPLTELTVETREVAAPVIWAGRSGLPLYILPGGADPLRPENVDISIAGRSGPVYRYSVQRVDFGLYPLLRETTPVVKLTVRWVGPGDGGPISVSGEIHYAPALGLPVFVKLLCRAARTGACNSGGGKLEGAFELVSSERVN